ncbi:signaling protein [Myxococcus xanthus]|uniref:Signaling protein n=2 Tax=Myxococcus xanthus TaxID=34 RepID=A0A7Y4MPJ0_MYXXA|nr:signaling protein [Myxococcus xanthus]NOJ86214.1 signaling protein [Myxococcus xanthus]
MMMRPSVLASVVVSGLLAACGTGAGPGDEGSTLDSQSQTLPANEVRTWYYTNSAFDPAEMVGERTQYCDGSNDEWGVTTRYYKRIMMSCDNGVYQQFECYDCTKFPCKVVPCPYQN